MKQLFTAKGISLIIIGISTIFFGLSMYQYRHSLSDISDSIQEYRDTTLNPQIQPTLQPTLQVSITPEQNEERIVEKLDENTSIIYKNEEDPLPWGVAEKVDDVTYTIRVGYDDQMGSAEEIVQALNQYRSVKGVNSLSWDGTLGTYAQSRADYFVSIDGTDKHEGFNTFLNDQDGFSKLGYSKVGENSYYGGPLSGTHLIEWVFAQSPGHNANQLDPGWTHVGIGVTPTAVNLIFASGRI